MTLTKEKQNLTKEEQIILHHKKLKQQKVANIAGKIIVYTFLTIMGLFILIPFYWMIITAFKGAEEVTAVPATLFPQNPAFFNFAEALIGKELGRYILNTVIVAIASTFFGTIISILAAFALSRLQFKGKEAVFSIFLATMMIPGEMMVLSNYLTVSGIGWADGGAGSDWGIVGPYMSMTVPFLVSTFHIYQLRQNFKQIPNELYYAAKVDGTSDWKYLWRVMVPLSKSSIVTIIILKIMGAWNSYAWPNLVASGEFKLITNGLREAFSDSGSGRTQYHLQMAATIIVTLPLLLVFIFFRKYIMRGVSRSGIKG